MESGSKLEDARILDATVFSYEYPGYDDECCEEDVEGFKSEEWRADDNGESNAVEDAKKDRSIWEEHRGEEGEEHAEVEDPESSLDGAEIHFLWLILVFIVVDGKADSYKEEKHDWYDDIELVDGVVDGEDAEVVEVPEDVKEDHKEDSEPSQDIKFNESLGGYFGESWIRVHFFSP